MKKVLLTITGMFLTLNIFAQTDSSSVQTDSVSVQTDTVTTVVDTVNYESMSKIQLSEIYLSELSRILNTLPNTAFVNVEENVPDTKYTSRKFEKTKNKCRNYTNALLIEYRELLPYSEKKDLITSIIFFKTL